MSGHSKWHKIQHQKGKNDKLRSNAFTKLLRAISVAAQHGGGDPEMNFTLRLAIEKAKAANVPKDNIERAIKKGSGELKDGEQFEEALYEGFGPGGVAVLVDTVTDNKTRTVAEVKLVMTKHGGTVGGPGSVQWQFNLLGVVRVSGEEFQKWTADKDELELQLIDAGAEDIIEEDGTLEVRCPRERLQVVSSALTQKGISPETAGLEWVPKETIDLSEQDQVKLETLYQALQDIDDVREVYTNAT